MLRILALSASAAVFAACSAAPPPAPVVDPVGAFEFSSTFQGQPITGSFEVTHDAASGAYSGWMVTSVSPEVPLIGVLVDGMTLTAEFETPDGIVTFQLTFTGQDMFSGNWSYLSDSGVMEGTRRVPA